MNTIHIKQLKLPIRLGVYAWELAIRRNIHFDIEFAIESQKASRTDDLADTLNYAEICQHLQQITAEQSYKLLETLAEQCARSLIVTFNLPWVKLVISKPYAIAQVKEISISLERHQHEMTHLPMQNPQE